MNEKNKQIKEHELKILKDEMKLNGLKSNYQKYMLAGVRPLEEEYKKSKIADFSTQAKREASVEKGEIMVKSMDEIKDLDYNIKVDKIELRFMEREFKIGLTQLE